MTNDDLLYRHRVQLFALAQRFGVTKACRELGYHRSTYYRWKPLLERHGLEILRPRGRRPPRMPNQVPPWMEERVVAFALGHPGLGPRRVAAQLALPMWGGQPISATGVLKVLRRHGLHTRRRRLALVAGYAAPPEPQPRLPPVPLHLEAEHPGDLVQLDCFHIGRLTGTKGRVWQYTAIDVASSFVWGEVQVTPLNPAARFTTALVGRVARDLAAAGWKLRAVSTDNGSEFRAAPFSQAVDRRGAKHRFIAPDGHRPTVPSSGCSAPSSKNAGDRPSPDRWCPSSPPCGATSMPICGTTTSNAPTLAFATAVGYPLLSSTVLGRCAQDEPHLSPHLESRSH